MSSINKKSKSILVQSDNASCLSSEKDDRLKREDMADAIHDSSFTTLELGRLQCSQEQNITISDQFAKKECSKSVTFDEDTQVRVVPRVSKDEKQIYFYSKQELHTLREEYIIELRNEYEFFQYRGLFKWNQVALSFYARFREFWSYQLSTFFCIVDHDKALNKANT
jgi:hypothetical protein